MAAKIWVVGAMWGLILLVGGLGVGGESDERKTGYNKCHHLFLRCTWQASHLLGPPLCFSLPIPPSSKYVPTHIPLERGGAGAAVVCFVHPRC